MSTRQFYNTPMSSLIPTEGGGSGGSTFYDLTPLTEQQRKMFNDLFALTPPLNFVENHMWFGKKPVGFFGTGNYKLFLQNGTFTMQPNITYRVRVVGGGGGGGREGNTTSGAKRMLGGAGGGYSEKIITCKVEEIVNITVGAGGSAGVGTADTNGQAGQAGGTSSFGTYLSATGGGGGSTSTVSGGKGVGGDINYTGGNCIAGSGSASVPVCGGASAASDFGNGISKTQGAGGNGLQSSATGNGGGGLFGNSNSLYGGGLWGNAVKEAARAGGGMFVDDGGACYTGDGDGVYKLELVQPQKYKTSNSAESQQNSFLQKDARQGLPKNNYEFTTRPMFGMGASRIDIISNAMALVKAGFGGGGANGTFPGWGGGWSGNIINRPNPITSNDRITSRPYCAFCSSFGAGGSNTDGFSGGNGAGVITGGEVDVLDRNASFPPQGGLGGGGGGSAQYVGSSSLKRNGNPGGYGAVLVEW